MPQEEKAKRANWVIQNETGLEELRSKVLAWLEGVRS
jgi:dephospho-CoA kinase